MITLVGPDHKFALNPKTWSEMTIAVKELDDSLGSSNKVIEKMKLIYNSTTRYSIWRNQLEKVKSLLRNILNFAMPPGSSELGNAISTLAKRF